MSDPRTEGYKRGLKGESPSNWGDAFNDVTVNPSGSPKERREGYQEGRRDKAYIEAQNKNKK
ncbi:hypothetical protein [Microcoleus sp. D3_18a_C4]|uniref:hypothetical protein n=1 Tax=Microcoleus sp. D3_18a_C4 TaxID=3055332 RepID=UPI002FD6817F